MPLPFESMSEEVMREFMNGLRRKLVKVHQRESEARGNPCVPTVSDFDLFRATEKDAELVGLV